MTARILHIPLAKESRTTALERHRVEQGSGRPRGYFLEDGTRVPSVTQILGATSGQHPGLEYWLMKNGFDAKRLQREALDVGSATHDAIESEIHGRCGEALIAERSIADGLKFQARCALAGWKEWRQCDGARYRFIGTELPFVSEKYHFGGTIDAVMMDLETGEFLIGEWKTSKHFNVAMPLQIAAYSLLLRECRDIEVSGAIVVKCSKLAAEARQLHIGDPTLPVAEKEFIRRRKSHFYTQQIANFYGMR